MCEGHARCTVSAVYNVTIHRIDMCNKPPGAYSTFAMCPLCTRATALRVGSIIGAMYEAMPEEQAGEILRCKTCQLWIFGLSDVLDVEWVIERETA